MWTSQQKKKKKLQNHEANELNYKYKQFT
jgi:hypothetical protein